MKGVLRLYREENPKMDIISLLADSAWIPVITAIITALVTFVVTKTNVRKDMKVAEVNSSTSDRVQLSKSQLELIAELRTMMQEQGDEMENLRKEIRDLQQVNINLMFENKKLQFKLESLNSRLTGMNDNNKINEGEDLL